MAGVAVIQMVSGADLQENLRNAARLIGEAAARAAELVVLPENFAFMGFHDSERLALAEIYQQGMIQDFLADIARRYGIWILAGTIPLKSANPQRIYSASLLFNAAGECLARYDKVHLFDVCVADAKKRYQESKSTEPGQQIIVADTCLGRLGLSVCYDIRFPELYRQQVQQGAVMLAVPAAFTRVTGEAHWEILCRARAIENLAYVLAAGQGGVHQNGRETYGHSMIVDPWGAVLARAETGEAVLLAEIDTEKQQRIRRDFPALQHRVFVTSRIP